MKFEKLNENKIRIILSNQDLIDKNIDFNSFMSNSIETQDLFLDMLEEAEEKIGFITKDYKIKIEALAMESGDFVVIITRLENKEETKSVSPLLKNKKIKVKRRSALPNSDCLVYSFKSFDDFCIFSNHMVDLKNYTNISKNTILYSYNSTYYLLFSKINTNHPYIRNFYALIAEFGTYINNPDLFSHKLMERGTIIMKNNAIKISSKFFPTTKSNC
ncbi:MAG: adaptor protein MecA [Clostridia bacterium]|nr:adaptor protein MecA [Clostridia bacterium]